MPPWSVFSPPGAEPGGAGRPGLHRRPDPLQRAHPGVPGVGDPGRVGRDEPQRRAARERLAQPQPRAQAVGLGGRGDLADELLAPRLGRQGDRPGRQHVPAPGGDGEREARQQDADDHRTYVRTSRRRRARLQSDSNAPDRTMARTRSTSALSDRSSRTGSTASASRSSDRLQPRRQHASAQRAPLAHGEQLARDDQLDVVEDPPELLGGEERERLEVLLPRGAVDRMHARRARQLPVLGGVADRRLVQEDQPGLAARVLRELVGEVREALVEQPVQPLLGQVADLREGDRQRVELQAQRLRVEAAARVQAGGLLPVGLQVQRAVGDGAQLARDLRVGVLEQVERRAVDLREHAERDGRLGAVRPVLRAGVQRDAAPRGPAPAPDRP